MEEPKFVNFTLGELCFKIIWTADGGGSRAPMRSEQMPAPVIATVYRRLFVVRSVCLSVTTVNRAKTAEPIDMPYLLSYLLTRWHLRLSGSC